MYERTGRDGEWARLVAAITPDFTDPATGGPLPGREDSWSIITSYRVRTRERSAGLARRHHAPEAHGSRGTGTRPPQTLAVPADSLTPHQQLTRSATSRAALSELGNILLAQDDPGCLPYYQEALTLSPADR